MQRQEQVPSTGATHSNGNGSARSIPQLRSTKTANAKTKQAASAPKKRTRLPPAIHKLIRKLLHKGLPRVEVMRRAKVSATAVKRQEKLLKEESSSTKRAHKGEHSHKSKMELAAPERGISGLVLMSFRLARKRAYKEVRAGRDFTIPELDFIRGFDTLMDMEVPETEE
jgi:hypothetical protein